MRKSDLVHAVEYIADLAPRQADDAVSAIFEQITNALARNEQINLVGFGRFYVKTRAERMGRNPKTGDAIVIPASQSIYFKPGKKLKESLQPEDKT